MKSGSGALVRIAGVTGILLLFASAVWWVNQGSADSLLSFAGRATKEEPTASPADTSLTTQDTVAVQTFEKGRLIRTASGVFVTSDGLILTTAGGAPYGSGSFTYAVLVRDGVQKSARRIGWDATARLVLLQVDDLDGTTVSFNERAVEIGDQITIAGVAFLEGIYTPVVVPGTIAYVTESGSAALSFDRAYTRFLQGARVLGPDGQTLGLLHTDVQEGLVRPRAIETFVRHVLSIQDIR